MQPDTRLSVIALHGIALSEEEVEQTANPVIERVGCPGVRWLFPRAPRREVTILGGPALAWYDVRTYDRTRMDEAGIERATAAICDEVRAERRRSGFDRQIVLMGFSQGGALALNAGLRLQGEIDGIVAIAGAILFPDRVVEPSSPPPVFLGHGFLDRKVPYSLGREAQQLLASRGYDTEFHSYLCGHTITRRTLRDLSAWLRGHFLGERSLSRAKAGSLGAAFRIPSRA